ncbi:hypothetical protein VH441_00545 [Psychrobacter sp. HD31]|uniref:hypothetical protein n=1 Tax=Psychrobacter sp. HD31 TaxID=3112003 RepID=UPI003DA310E0
MRPNNRQQRLRDWWEFQHLYQILSDLSNKSKQKSASYSPQQLSKNSQFTSQIKTNIVTSRTQIPYKNSVDSNLLNHNNNIVNNNSASYRPNHHRLKMLTSRQNQSKRQREWIYLTHYLAITGLNPIHIISGNDDGREPDFTLVFYHDSRLYYVGVELTTLPRLRDNMGDKALISKRWYWQSLHKIARLREKEENLETGAASQSVMYHYDRFRVPMSTLYMPAEEFAKRPSKKSMISQDDMDAVMEKKAHKVEAYHTRRPLQELWLLVHTDKYQPENVLTAPDYKLFHDSGYDQIHVTRYPSHKVINVNKQGALIN